MPDAAGCKPPLLPDAAGCKPTPLSAIATAIATWLGALSRSLGIWAHHKKREGGRAEVQEKAQEEKRYYLHRSVWCTFRLRDADGCRSPILPDAAGCEPSPLPGCRQMQRKISPDASEKTVFLVIVVFLVLPQSIANGLRTGSPTSLDTRQAWCT